ncbi:hypothetical protein THAOC_15841 [Thalassiosira oceanica]|uniref:Sugar phosphate phosphatase n=1 Tax=Thalassiosira oceanica TaxID=159749 RepID=K0SBH6_THAOC|nr:hypothetical protein THAOC_15841 [Thalassiosira oceanica]|eukprot:EJK63498.1 hypothetical protein THAOC_15841 [Thalassiosira oceanica]
MIKSACIVVLFEFALGATAAFGTEHSSPRSSRKMTPTSSLSEAKHADSLPGDRRMRNKPRLPIPEPLLSDKPGTWAHDTMSRRLNKDILQRTFDENQAKFESAGFSQALKRFNLLRSELDDAANTKLRPIEFDRDSRPADVVRREKDEWNEILAPYQDDTWLSAPWLVTEFYAYRRLIEALGYYDEENPDTYLFDPFAVAKMSGLETSVKSAETMLGKVKTLPKTRQGLGVASQLSLWGNKMDLSIWPADAENSSADVFESILVAAGENMLHDDTSKLAEHCEELRQKGGGSIDIIVDNAGFELVTDLALADHLIDSGLAKVVTFQLKSHPTFVSDALEKDLIEHVEFYASLSPIDFPNAHEAGVRWKGYLETGAWVCNENDFWVQPTAMWSFPSDLREEMNERCDLAFVKGDANYRRLLGDRYWNYSASFQDIIGCCFPCPVCALRTLKAEVACGIAKEEVERAKSLDEEWMTNGRFGVIHFGTGQD